MQLNSSDILAVMAKNDLRLVVEHAFPRGRLKGEVITLRTANLRHIEPNAPTFAGVYSNLLIPREFLDSYIRELLVQIEKDDAEFIVYILTNEGRARGVAQAIDTV